MRLFEGNQGQIDCVAYQSDGVTPKNLTGLVVEAYFKLRDSTADNDASTVKLSTATSGVTITNASAGQFRVTVPPTSLTTNHKWWRADVVEVGIPRTVVYGRLVVQDM